MDFFFGTPGLVPGAGPWPGLYRNYNGGVLCVCVNKPAAK